VSLYAAGLDPDKCIVFVQSHVAEHTELNWLLTSVTPLGELERQTQFKDKAQRQESILAGAAGLPDPAGGRRAAYKSYPRSGGEDQVQHLELMREIARRWNGRYGAGFFPEPQPLLTKTKRVLASTARPRCPEPGHTIGLFESPEAIWEKLRPAPRTLPCDPEGSRHAGDLQHLHVASGILASRYHRQGRAAVPHRRWGCLDCKRVLADNMIAILGPMRERAAALRREPRRSARAVARGRGKARALARRTIAEVRDRMGFLKLERIEVRC